MQRLTPLEIDDWIKQCNSWIINKEGHLHKEYQFKDFKSALHFANQVGKIAEKKCHHPNIFISWGVCHIELWTHSINGLTAKDFELVQLIDLIAN